MNTPFNAMICFIRYPFVYIIFNTDLCTVSTKDMTLQPTGSVFSPDTSVDSTFWLLYIILKYIFYIIIHDSRKGQTAT